jgi:hypothetical protein
MELFGYVFDRDRYYGQPEILRNREDLVKFIKDNFDAAKLVVTDMEDKQILLIRDGVDLFNDLDHYGIILEEIFNEIRADWAGNADDEVRKPDWEILYDSIGLSSGEIAMRQRVKRECLAARTVQDVAELMRGTYFAVYFYSPEKEQCWGYFNESDFTATIYVKNEDGYWSDTGTLVQIPRDGRVKHLRSAEDVHDFLLYDLPTEQG